MSKRITVMLGDKVERKLRSIQAKQIQTEVSSVSFSRVLNEQLEKVLKI